MLYYKTFVENGDGAKKQSGIQEDRDVVKDNEITEQHENSMPDTKAWLLEKGGFLIEYSDGSRNTIPMEVDKSFYKIIEAIINHHGAATHGQLTELKGVNNPGRVLRRTIKTHKALEEFIEFPKRKGDGYTTTIKLWEPGDNAEDK